MFFHPFCNCEKRFFYAKNTEEFFLSVKDICCGLLAVFSVIIHRKQLFNTIIGENTMHAMMMTVGLAF